ncbi:MAG: hypothetical protein Q9174_006811, partial [Haloplaca sp. 1 TL-2023]
NMASTQKDYKVTLKNETLFANVLYGLSKVGRNTTSGLLYCISKIKLTPTSSSKTMEYRHALTDVRKRLRLLDSIALLLAFTPGDVAATGMLQEGNQVTIYWAKTDGAPLTIEGRQYVEALEQSFRTSKSLTEPLEVVIPMCKKNILHRINKLLKLLDMTKSNNLFDLTSASERRAEELRSFLAQKKLISPDMSLVATLDSFAREAATLTADSSTFSIQRIVTLASHMTSLSGGKSLEDVPGVSQYRYHRLQKIGDYHVACGRILKAILKRSPAMRDSLRLERLIPPATKCITIHTETIRALNGFAADHAVEPIATFEDLQQVHRDADPGVAGTREIQSTQHCELTVGLTLWQKKQDKQSAGALEIGCSKARCYYCDYFIWKFNEWARRQPQVNQIITSAYSEKRTNGWVMPKCPPEVETQVLNHVDGLVYDVCSNVAMYDSSPGGKGYPEVIDPRAIFQWE